MFRKWVLEAEYEDGSKVILGEPDVFKSKSLAQKIAIAVELRCIEGGRLIIVRVIERV